MKKITNLKNFFVLICLLTLSIGYSQVKRQTSATLFGEPIKSETVNPDNGIIRCGTVEYEKFLQKNDPRRLTDEQFEAWIAPLIKKQKAMQALSSEDGGIITIPVVVHVIHNGQAVGVAPNITDSQVRSQITVMTEDYRRMFGTPGYNTNAVGADTGIQFVLAQEDPNGNPTNGIDRVNLCQESWSTADINAIVKPTTIWDPTQYLNMWSVDFTDNTLLGYAQFPSASGLDGLNASGGAANTDGVVANYATFGSIDYDDGTFLLTAPYNKGRTMTHEVGHWLGLRHIWGDGNNCNTNTDYCADTPVALTANYSCATVVNSCPTKAGNDMVENYMDYTDDTCMNIFTQNQKDRMVVVMDNSPRRLSLRTSTKDLPIALFANDAEVKVEAFCSSVNPKCITSLAGSQKVTIYNRGTNALTSVTLNYAVNGGNTNTYNWTGNLATHESETFDMPVNATTNGPIAVSVATANGAADERATNNESTGTFSVPVPPTDYNFNTYAFKLKRDNYGSETTWNLKNSAGTILYSGGPYTNQNGGGPIISQTWTLADNDCYSFTINDAYGDGICCAEGAGYYNIKSTDGLTVIAEGASFGSGESKAFSVNYVLANNTFKANTTAIFVYPNPTNGTLKIALPDNFGLPNSYSINNSLGQVLAQKTIQSENDLSINTASLSSGVYFITVTKDNERKTLRFIKQ